MALRAAIKSNSELFREVFDASFQKRMFSRIWKRQRLVLIPKSNNAQDASGYHPLCMIEAVGELLEKIIYRRLEATLTEEGFAERQFGFRKARSTIDAIEMVVTTEKISGKLRLEGENKYCVIITLIVKNAFNSADWNAMLAALGGKDVLNYLLHDTADG